MVNRLDPGRFALHPPVRPAGDRRAERVAHHVETVDAARDGRIPCQKSSMYGSSALMFGTPGWMSQFDPRLRQSSCSPSKTILRARKSPLQPRRRSARRHCGRHRVQCGLGVSAVPVQDLGADRCARRQLPSSAGRPSRGSPASQSASPPPAPAPSHRLAITPGDLARTPAAGALL